MLEHWLERHGRAGLTEPSSATGPFEMTTQGGFLFDEGLANSVCVMARAFADSVARRE